MSDTHMAHGQLTVPEGDIAIHAGDGVNEGTFGELAQFARWYGSLPHKLKLYVAGNHCWPLQRGDLRHGFTPADARKELADNGIDYLEDASGYYAGLNFYGSPWTPEFGGWAFNLPNNQHQLRNKWRGVPPGVDVLITHGPPWGILDSYQDRDGNDVHLGDLTLTRELERIKPRLHVFGHIHVGHGQVTGKSGTHYVNAAVTDVDFMRGEYVQRRQPIVVDLEERK